MEETNIKPIKKNKAERQAGPRAEKVPTSMLELEVAGLRNTCKQAERASYCLKDYKGKPHRYICQFAHSILYNTQTRR